MLSRVDLGLKGWRPERSSSANPAQQSGVLERRTSVGTKTGKRKAPSLKGAGAWEEDAFQWTALSPVVSGGAEVRGSGRVQPGALTEVGVGPLRYWIARNKQTSFCSQPWPPPCRIQDVCVSSSLLCLNSVCGMTCKEQVREPEPGSLCSVLSSALFPPYWII